MLHLDNQLYITYYNIAGNTEQDLDNYIQIHNNKDPSWEYKHYMFNKQFFN